MKKKVLLAFSGGLDTSYCVKYFIHDKDLEVHTAIVNTGGFSPEELKKIEEHALKLGAKTHQTIDGTADFYDHIVKYLIFGNILKNNTYPLSVSAERIYQAKALAEYAKKIGADYIAHGSTGAGNDQIRFDLVFQLVAPELEILTPVRNQVLSRQDEIAYLKKYGVTVQWEKSKYSLNKGLWGTSIGGKETLTSHEALPEEAFLSHVEETEPKTIEIGFEKGEIVTLNGKNIHPVEAIQKIDQWASAYAIGRDMHTGDTIIGIKGRIGFEAAAASVIIKSHHVLEKHTLTKWQLYWKEQLANWYGMFLHEAQYFEPVMRNIENFLTDTQKNVTGTVKVKFIPYRFEVLGIQSEHDLMNSGFGDYGEINKAWTGEDVKGFIKIMSNPMKIYQKVNGTL
ncbi:argininosuccinate synthase [Candidatus Sulfidibacterium hydrothermale]|uniref:argininosuccinate synthase n=1 Tax=Candidatus Sulfidibacterium hydrothermale TaxID=2875962 RepID=UPI001F0B0FAE|nr:argininosuccinate synthase [Candidatus Sulfidibacterium hydrothermale]UBM61403.1 argininosuccinate synthase [Candidatus Sulfidibacterium hydrothermale]